MTERQAIVRINASTDKRICGVKLALCACALTGLLGLGTAGQQGGASAPDPCASAVSTLAMAECWGHQYEIADTDLNRVYKELMNRLPESEKNNLREAQRAWISKKEKKGAAAAAECEGGTFAPVAKTIAVTEETRARTAELRKSYAQFLPQTSPSAAAPAGEKGQTPAPASKAQGKELPVAGSWIYVKGPTDFESVDFAQEGKERIFRSYLHDRPAWFGHWTLSGDKLTAQTEGGEKIAWTVMSATGEKLVLKQEDEEEPTTFKKAK